MEIHTWEMFQFLILVTLYIRGKADFTCFSSKSSEAKDITLVFDKHHDTTNLWERNISERNISELAPCDFSSIFSSKCSVCLNDSARPETVLLVFWNLTGNEELRMEGGSGKLFFHQIDCPRPEPVSTAGPVTKQKSGLFKTGGAEPNNQRGRIGLYIFLSCFIALLLLLIWLAWKHRKPQTNLLVLQASVDASNGVSFDPGNGSVLINRNGSVV